MCVRHQANIFWVEIHFGLPYFSCGICHATGSFFLRNQTQSSRNDPLWSPSLISGLVFMKMLHWLISWGPFQLGLSYRLIMQLECSFTAMDRKVTGLLNAGNYDLPAGKRWRARKWRQVWVFCSVFQSGVFGVVCIRGRSTTNSCLFWRVQSSSTFVASLSISTSVL